jgi:hypothetical protein
MNEQLPMFINPAEVIENTVNGVWGSIDGINTYTGWRYKLANALDYGGWTESAFEDIQSWQAFTPITLMIEEGWSSPYVQIGNGHHRVATAEAVGMKLIPVVWSEDSAFESYESQDGDPEWADRHSYDYF